MQGVEVRGYRQSKVLAVDGSLPTSAASVCGLCSEISDTKSKKADKITFTNLHF